MRNQLILKGVAVYENIQEQAVRCGADALRECSDIPGAGRHGAGIYRDDCSSAVLCKRKLDLLRIEPLTTALFFSLKLQLLLWKTMLFERSKRSMDEMKIGSKFTTSIISKLASLAIRKKFGYDVKLNLNEVKATVVDGKTHVHLDIDADLEKDELTKILKSIGL